MDMAPKPVSGCYEWVVPNFAEADGSLTSPTFEVGGYTWCLTLFPKGDVDASKVYVSFFLFYCDAHKCPPESLYCPGAAFSLKIKSNKGSALDHVKREGCTFSSDGVDWGFSDFIERSKVTANDSGFLAADGSIVLRVDLMVENPRRPVAKLPPGSLLRHPGPAPPGLAADLLALLEDPGATSDLTVIVGPGNGSAAGGSAGGGAGGSGGQPQRPFHVHRAVLAARCPFFRTLFNAGMADSAARELPLPDADPDAFAVLLRYMYGGEVPHCERAVHRAAVTLCDTLLLVKEALERRLVEDADADTITADLLWAAGHGREHVLEELVAVYKRVGKDVDPAQVVAMAAANPPLVARVLIGMAV